MVAIGIRTLQCDSLQAVPNIPALRSFHI